MSGRGKGGKGLGMYVLPSRIQSISDNRIFLLLPLRAGVKRRHRMTLRDNVMGITKPVRSFAFFSLPLLDSANHYRRQFAASLVVGV